MGKQVLVASRPIHLRINNGDPGIAPAVMLIPRCVSPPRELISPPEPIPQVHSRGAAETKKPKPPGDPNVGVEVKASPNSTSVFPLLSLTSISLDFFHTRQHRGTQGSRRRRLSAHTSHACTCAHTHTHTHTLSPTPRRHCFSVSLNVVLIVFYPPSWAYRCVLQRPCSSSPVGTVKSPCQRVHDHVRACGLNL